MKSFTQFKKELLRNKKVKKAYDNLAPEFELIKLVIRKRIDEKITQKELARRIGTKQSAIARFESGSYNPSLTWVRSVAHALDARIKISIVSK